MCASSQEQVGFQSDRNKPLQWLRDDCSRSIHSSASGVCVDLRMRPTFLAYSNMCRAPGRASCSIRIGSERQVFEIEADSVSELCRIPEPHSDWRAGSLTRPRESIVLWPLSSPA